MKSYWFLYLPALLFFALPIISYLITCHQQKNAIKQQEDQRRRAAENKQARQAAREHAAEVRRSKNTVRAASGPKRKPGRPRKNPPEQRPEIILETHDQEEPAPLPSSCTPEQFAAWI